MALDKARRANKKYKSEAKRRKVQKSLSMKRAENKIRQRRTRKMMLEGRREFLAKRAADRNYLAELESEINDGDSTNEDSQ